MGWDLGLERHRQQFGELLLMVKLQASPFFPSCDSCFMNRAVWKSQQQPIKHVSLVSPFRCQQASDIQCSCLLPTQKQLLLGMNFCSSELSRHRLAASGIKISTVIGFTVWRHVPEDRWVVLFLYRLCRSCHHTLRSCVGDSFGSAWDGRSWSGHLGPWVESCVLGWKSTRGSGILVLSHGRLVCLLTETAIASIFWGHYSFQFLC